MSTALSKSQVSTDVVVRAVGITLVVLDHATSVRLASPLIMAGLNVLLLVSGYSFGRFLPRLLTGPELRRSALLAAKAITLPSLVMIVASQLFYAKFKPLDLLLIGNFFTANHPALYPVWYTMVIVQIMVVIGCIFSVPAIREMYNKQPIFVMAAVVVAAYVARGLSFHLWNTGYLDNRLPQQYLWNFLGGWLIWCGSAKTETRTKGMMACLLFLGITSLVWFPTQLRWWTTVGAAVALTLTPRVTLPFVFARATLVLSQSTLYLFLFHYIIIYCCYYFYESPWTGFDVFLISMVTCVGLWVVSAATGRAYARLQADWRSHQSRTSSSAPLAKGSSGDGQMASVSG